MNVPIVRAVADLRTIVAGWRREAASIAVVPTMGALHEGHLSLVRAALEKADRVIVTLFINPKQFNSAADLAAYPRTEVEDAAKLAPLGAHLLYAPDAAEIYPEGFATAVSVGGVSEGLCGAFRPGHFDGVATVVAKLFLQTGADLAFFGSFMWFAAWRGIWTFRSPSSAVRQSAKKTGWRSLRATSGSHWRSDWLHRSSRRFCTQQPDRSPTERRSA